MPETRTGNIKSELLAQFHEDSKAHGVETALFNYTVLLLASILTDIGVTKLKMRTRPSGQPLGYRPPPSRAGAVSGIAATRTATCAGSSRSSSPRSSRAGKRSTKRKGSSARS